jgi:probable F420-dependent oxidoreductase
MNYGIILPSYGDKVDPAEILDTALAAEEYGYDSIWTTDHILLPVEDSARFRNLYEAVTTLAFLAGRTQRIRLGISSLVLPMRDPILVARQMAALDALSRGRTQLCVSVGWSEGEYRSLGYDFHTRGRRLDEAVEVMRTLWGSPGKPVSFDGTFYQFQDSIFEPAPVQDGGPELWVGGNSQAARKRAVRLGAVWHPSSTPIEEFTAGAAAYHELAAGGHGKGIVPRVRVTYGISDPDAPLNGTPEEIRSQLAAYRAAGMTGVVLSFNASGPAERLAAMRSFMETVVRE